MSSSASRTMDHVVCIILIHFLVAFAQGQGPGVIEMSLVEESPAGTIVGSVAAVPNYSYTFQDATNLFEINSSGTLRTLKVIDREALPNPVIRLSVIGRPANASDRQLMFNVVITVLDINDNAPVFHTDGGREKISFQEDVGEGRKNIVTATDPDEGVNGTVGRYDIVSGNNAGMFGLDFSGLPLILYVVKKKGAESFDREKLDHYQLNISARDNGTPPNYGFMLVDISITDVNDNTPAFDFSEYTTQVNESTPVGTSVFRAEATDSDLELNGEIIYRLEDDSHQFRIDENTGVIETIISPLRCTRRCGRSTMKCNPNSCFIQVEASDRGLNALTGRAYVYIEVLDENDHDPVITFSKDGSIITSASVDENASNQTSVFSVTVTDKDNGANGETSLRIIKGNEEGYFYHLSLPAYGFNEIQVARPLDRETIGRFNLTFEAVDNGTPRRSSTAYIIITVNDANDHPPEFEFSEYKASLSEFTKPHSYVASVRATDKDEGMNSKLTYEIAAGNEPMRWFAVDEDTGLVTTIANLDHEETSQVILNISAHDGGTDQKYSFATLFIDILDENDYIPKFSQDFYVQELTENSAPNTDFLTLKTIDLDSGDNGSVVYLVHPDTQMQFPNTFSIHPTSGNLTALKSFDREQKDKYIIKIVAHDKGAKPLSSTTTIELSIKDVNDNRPKFSPKEYYVNVYDNDPEEQQIVRVMARDKDAGAFGKVTYSIASDVCNSSKINADSGVISTYKKLSSQKCRLTVQATDGDGLTADSVAGVNILVISASSIAMEFTNSSYEFPITEDNGEQPALLDRAVGRVEASSNAGKTITYAITGGDPEGVFKIDSSSGIIRNQLAVDREERSKYILTVIAHDGGKIGSGTVTVLVNDLNDNAPVFNSLTTEATVLENWPVGYNIFLAQATDSDAGPNKDVSYSLSSFDETNGVFAINASSGVISLAKPPNHMPGRTATLNITATDAGALRKSNSMSVKVRIVDVNDHTPVFYGNRFELFLSEAQPVNQIVKQMSAVDADKEKNGELTYSIAKGNEDKRFDIFPDGSLYVAHELDRELKDMYFLTISVKDSGLEPRSSSVNITIYVLDENDNTPNFTQEIFEFSIKENSNASTYVGSVTANDDDIGRNAEILYFLGDFNDNFSIDPIMGTIYSKKMFDREYIFKTTNLGYYMLDVFAVDNGIKKLQSKVTVKVNVLDENDNPPVFVQGPGTIVAISENTNVNDVVFTLSAVDADDGTNAAVSYAIVSGSDAGKFGIQAASGQLYLKDKLDREVLDQYLLIINATDTGIPIQLAASITLQIYVVDYNDNVPQFAPDTKRSISVSESTDIGETLIIFSGSDKDMGNNAKLRYDIVCGNEDDIFLLDVYSGKLSLARSLDYESQKINNGELTLNITLSDSGFPALSVATMFTVKILDANDNAPEFTDGFSKVYPKENKPIGSKIANLTAVDRDSGDFGRVLYSIYKQTPGGDHFYVNEITGEITIKELLDRETEDTYKVTIQAIDQDSNVSQRKTAEKSLTIFVEDVNDNSPVFTSPSVFLVASTSTGGSTVASITAMDADHGDNGKVSYSFSGITPPLFNLNPTTGTVSLAQNLPSSPYNYTLNIAATDGGKNDTLGAKSTTISITILLYTPGSSGPTFSSTNPSSGSINENVGPGKSIARITSLSSRAEYYITKVTVSGKPYGGLFSIERSTGVISTATNVDREALPGDIFQLDISAVESDSAGQRATTTQVTIRIEDENDSPPEFSSSMFDASVSEMVTPGTSVAWILVSDPDITGRVLLSLRGPDSDLFRIEQNGTLFASKNLDYEAKTFHNFTVEATDSVHTSSAKVYIYVIDENDHSPVFSQVFYSFDILEDAEIGHTIGSVPARDADSGNNGRVIYEFVSEWGQDYFQLDSHHGNFILKKQLDFEERQLYALRVIGKDGGLEPRSTEVRVYMNVKDVNDNQPEFDPMSYYREISEDAVPGTPVVNVSATDVDTGLNGTVRYSILGDSSFKFGIGPLNGSLYTTETLDREVIPVYTVVVMATDQCPSFKDRMSTTTTVQVKLTDINDSPPVFMSPTVIEITEDAKVESTVYTVSVVDLDEGINSQITFKLISPASPFSIDPRSGALVLKSPLDRETISNYTLRIEAKDGGSPSKSAEQTLMIVVGDTNDNIPKFTQDLYKATFPEDVAVGTTMLRIQATDLDEGLNCAVRYFIVEGEGCHDFHLDMSSGILRVQKLLDFERTQSYTIIVQAEDSSVENPLHSNATIIITVTDVNDFVPVFDDSPYDAFVQENMLDGPVPVITITARDDDSGNNGLIQYDLRDIDTYSNMFSVNSSTGEIFVVKSLDREKTPLYELTFVAKDCGSPVQISTATVTVFVKDVNDHTPTFESQGPYLAHILENGPSGTEVITVSATDQDEGINSQIMYSLVDILGSPFTIQPSTGRLLTTSSLDRELEPQYLLTVVATDQGIPPRSSSAQVVVDVDDENDHAPQFGTTSYIASVYDSSNTGDFVLGVTAVDQDTGINGKVVYSLEGPDDSYFSISREMGVVTLARLLSDAKRRLTFVVRASDMGKIPLSSSASVVVNLSSTSSTNRPKFTNFDQNIRITENAIIGKVVTTAKASSPINTRISYYIVGGNVNNAFAINSDSGVISVASRIDYEVTSLFSLWVEARDQSSIQLSTYQKLAITVDDENDNAPVFSISLYTAEIDENCDLNTTVTQVTAVDADFNINGQVSYVIRNGNENNTFAVNSVTGRIYTINPTVDREKIALYNLEIEAFDMGVPRQSATTTVRITIADKNDNSPTFTGSRMVAVPEDLPIGSFIMQLTTTDLDIGDNARTNFSFQNIIDVSGFPFAINASTGVITNIKQLDCDNNQNRFTIQVSVTDGSFNQITSCVVRILDVNDNPPRFQNSFLVFNFIELQLPNTKVVQLSALDQDKSSPNNKFFFSLKRPSSLFELNSETGDLFALETMHFFGGQPLADSMNDHTIDVLVTDLGFPSLSSMATVVVRITDANDHAPVFQKDLYYSAVPKNLLTSQRIIQVVAEDKMDFGKNADVIYEIISGSGMPFFSINSTSGEIYPKVLLSAQVNKKFVLIIKAKDNGVPVMSSNTTVELSVTEDNNNSPRFSNNRFQKEVNEDVAIGYLIDTITATDDDPGLNGEVGYYITAGNEAGLFGINSTDGSLTVKGKLDYETKSSYNITITARDKALYYKEAWKVYEIILVDVNDNKPVFDRDYYDAYIQENSDPNASVFTVTANDADHLYINTEICYSIVGDSGSKNFFKINQKTGDISSSNTVFDYEQRNLYTLLIMAYNPEKGNCESATLKSVTTIYVHITGENEDTPHFIQKSYSFQVNESAEIGTSVGQVKALDNDAGVDGIVYYYLEGQSNLKGFIIEPVTGVVKVSKRPDYESSPYVVLSVIAKNWGSVQGNDTDTCTINITVLDANDPPEFSKEIYQANISENSGSGTYVIMVHAEDRDSRPENRDFSYQIIGGNEQGQFLINPSGKIETTGKGILDRETVSKYSLVVGARDTHDPKIIGSATVEIVLTDVNDNAPKFNPEELKANVSENETVGQEVIVLKDYTVDADLPPNQGPYTYKMVPGPWTDFFAISDTTGRVETKQILNRESQPQFIVSVVVTDNGSPKMTSTLSFTVVVYDINNSPPKPRPLTVLVSHLENYKVFGKIAEVNPIDSDLTGKYNCKLLDFVGSPFAISPECDLNVVGDIYDSTYMLKVQGSDEKFPPVEYNVTVVIESVTNKTLTNSVAVTLGNERASSFLEKKYLLFKRQVEEAFGTSFQCKIFSLKEVNSALYVMLYVHDREQKILSSKDINRGLTDAKVAIEVSANVIIQSVAASQCNVNPCRNGGGCSTVVTFLEGTSIFDSSAVVITSPNTGLGTACFCTPAYTGQYCELQQQLCGSEYCNNGGVCSNGVCQCPDEWIGNFCQTDVNECQTSAPCKNGATCRNTKGSFQCDCALGYHGPYCDSHNFCTSRPCSEHGKCKELPDSFQCICDYGYHGASCQFSSMSFDEGSYAQFRPVDNYQLFNLSLYFATVESSALIMFSPVTIRGPDKGFVAIEILNSKIKVSFQLEPQENGQVHRVITVSTTMVISDGNWYKVDFTKMTRTANLMVRKCLDSVCDPCTDKNPECYSETDFVSSNLPVQGLYISIGGVRSFGDILYHNGDISTHDFRGCIHSVSINGRPFEINRLDPGNNTPEDMFNVTEVCPRTQAKDLCGDDDHVCYNNGVCVDRWSHTACKCSSDYMDDVCLIKKQPFTLGNNAEIKYSLRPSYFRDVKLSELISGSSSRRRREALSDSSVTLRFRTKSDQGMLFSSYTDSGNRCMIWIAKKKVHFLLRSEDVVMDPLTVDTMEVSDSNWHNVSVTVSGSMYNLDVDGQSSGTRDLGIVFNFDPLDISLEMSTGGKVLLPNNQEINSLNGCLSQFLINGQALPLNGSTEKYNIKITGDVEGACSALCDNNPCKGDNKCVVEGEGYQCLLVAVESAGLEAGIIVVIVFFAILLVAIIVVFALFQTRRDLFQRCVQNKKQNKTNNKIMVDNIIPAGGSNGSASPYTLNADEEEMIIRNHIAENLTGPKPSSLTARPDLIGTGYSPQPLQLSDGTVIMETSAVNNLLSEEDVPEHYDFENASSIAPSDIAPSDMIRHYRDFRNGTHLHHHHHHHHHHIQQQQPLLNNHLFNKYRDSPASLSNCKANMNNGVLVRQSPLSAVSVPTNNNPMIIANGGRPSSALPSVHLHEGMRTRMSPLTQLNVRNPRTLPHNIISNSNNSRSNSTQSIGSHHSHSSSSSATGVPNGHICPYTHSLHKPLNNKQTSGRRSRPPKGLTVEDIHRLNARPDLTDPVNLMDTGSSSIDGHTRVKHHTLPPEPGLDSLILLEPPDSSSDDSGANDSFTCSEFEYDNENTKNRLDLDPGKMIFSKLTEVENETDEIIPQHQNQNGKLNSSSFSLNPNGDPFLFANESSSPRSPTNQNQHPITNQYDFDALLTWGPNFDRLVGVFRDIAQLPDTSQKIEGSVDHDYEEYV